MTCELMALAQGNSGAAWAPRLCVWPIRHGPKWCEFGVWTASRIRTHQKCPKLEIDTTWYKYTKPYKTHQKLHETKMKPIASWLLPLLCWGNLTDVLIFAHPLEEAGSWVRVSCRLLRVGCRGVKAFYRRKTCALRFLESNQRWPRLLKKHTTWVTKPTI